MDMEDLCTAVERDKRGKINNENFNWLQLCDRLPMIQFAMWRTEVPFRMEQLWNRYSLSSKRRVVEPGRVCMPFRRSIAAPHACTANCT
jgi:hypothetical protein